MEAQKRFNFKNLKLLKLKKGASKTLGPKSISTKRKQKISVRKPPLILMNPKSFFFEIEMFILLLM
jgi:hypothetical protein